MWLVGPKTKNQVSVSSSDVSDFEHYISGHCRHDIKITLKELKPTAFKCKFSFFLSAIAYIVQKFVIKFKIIKARSYLTLPKIAHDALLSSC